MYHKNKVVNDGISFRGGAVSHIQSDEHYQCVLERAFNSIDENLCKKLSYYFIHTFLQKNKKRFSESWKSTHEEEARAKKERKEMKMSQQRRHRLIIASQPQPHTLSTDTTSHLHIFSVVNFFSFCNVSLVCL